MLTFDLKQSRASHGLATSYYYYYYYYYKMHIAPSKFGLL